MPDTSAAAYRIDATPDTGDIAAAEPDALYGPGYYASHCGPVPYERNDHWLRFFGQIADELVRAFAPRRAFDAGCALGLLVECLWDRGVQAYGRDISGWAIGQVRADVRPFCHAGSIAEPIEGEYDLLTCIEVLEHMPEAAALQAITVMAAAAPRILFSSSPTDLEEPTHCNVRPTAYWLARWAEAGFAPSTTHDTGYLAPHAFILERSEDGRSARDLAGFADRIRHRVAMSQLGNRLFALQAEKAAVAAELAQTRADLDSAHATARADAAAVAEATRNADAAHAAAVAAAHRTAQAEVATLNDAMAALRDGHAAALQDAQALQADQAAAQARHDAQQRRVRASAAQRSVEARGEAVAAHAQARAMRQRAEAAEATVANATTAAQRATAAARRDRERALAVEHDAAQLRAQVLSAQEAWRGMVAERDRLLASTVWRATWPLRAGAQMIPGPVRFGARKGLTASWWALTGQLGSRLRRRSSILADAAAVAASPLFDAGWYAGRYADVRAGGIDPALHYATVGGQEGRDPGPRFSAQRYMAQHPDATASGRPALLHFLESGHGDDWAPPVPELPELGLPEPELPEPELPPLALATPEPPPKAVEPPPEISLPPAVTGPPTLDTLLHERFAALEPLRTYAAPHDAPRITIVTDSINAGSLYGGVGTALILAALLAQRLGAGLRLVTRTEPPDAANIAAVLAVHGIAWDGNVELLHAPPGPGGRDVPVGPRDLFLTTSWWTTWATRRAVNPARIAYLLQEDERGFYPLGDDHLRCTETLSDPGLLYIVNSGLLMRHLQADGLAPGGVAFEPAFPAAAYHRELRPAGSPRGFFFYARPHNPRNLYWRGLEAVGAAIEEGVLDPAAWDFHFVGKAAQDMRLPGGVRPRLVHNLPWADYAGLVRRMDLGLSLMDTPHPSYPPLDLAASGAVVVTNRFGAKTSLEGYSRNILTAEPTVAGLVDGLRRAVALAMDEPARAANYAGNGLLRDWNVAFAPVLDRLAHRSQG